MNKEEEQEIKELAEWLDSVCHIDDTSLDDYTHIPGQMENCYNVAYGILEQGYRKVNEDEIVVKAVEWDYLIGKKVVLCEELKENTERIQLDLPPIYHKLTKEMEIKSLTYEQVRKETAKEILQALYNRCYERAKANGGKACDVIPIDILQFAEHYGVEIEQ